MAGQPARKKPKSKRGARDESAPAAPPRRDDKADRKIAATAKRTPAKVPFPRKNQQPTETEFLARLPLVMGKKFEGLRAFLKKQKDVTEDLYFYGPKTGWAFRYVRGGQSLATVMIHDERLMGIVSLDAAALATVDFGSLSAVGQHARRMAHGSPALSWLDLPLDGTGTADFRALLKAKLKTLPAAPGPPPPPPARIK